MNVEPTTEDLENPAFLEYAKQRCGGFPIQPDLEDVREITAQCGGPLALDASMRQHGERVRLAQAHKLMRICREWQAR
jgi:hypothetical protein